MRCFPALGRGFRSSPHPSQRCLKKETLGFLLFFIRKPFIFHFMSVEITRN